MYINAAFLPSQKNQPQDVFPHVDIVKKLTNLTTNVRSRQQHKPLSACPCLASPGKAEGSVSQQNQLCAQAGSAPPDGKTKWFTKIINAEVQTSC